MNDLTLPAHLDLETAQEIKQSALAAAEAKADLRIQGAEVATVSASALQTIIAANNHMRSADQQLILQTPSEPFLAAFEGLGFYSELMKAAFEQ